MKGYAPLAMVALAAPALSQTFTQPPLAVDIDPAPNRFEMNLVAAPTTWEYTPGVQTNVWAYNGSVPGPTIQVKLGDNVKINFTNNLAEPTTVHWHGVEAPATVDGSHISQNPIPPGGTYTYEWTASNEGMHWYHPHVRTFDQVEQGLHGVIIIRNTAREGLFGFGQLAEKVIVFDDVLLDANNQVVPAFSFSDPLQNAIYSLNGREGNLLLVNGKAASLAQMTIPNGQPQRWRVLNAANSTFCRLDLRDPVDGIDESLWQIGTDGGFIQKPFKLFDITTTVGPPDNAPPAVGDRDPIGVDHPTQALLGQMGEGIFLMPGERLDVVFTPIGNDGETFTVYNQDWYRGRHTATFSTSGAIMLGSDPLDGMYPKQNFLDITVTGPDPGTGEFVLPTTLRNFPAWVVPAKGQLPYTFGHGNPDPVTGDVTFFAQAEMISGVMNPLPTKKVTSFKAHDIEVGDVWEWTVTNLSHGEHPFHTHGFPFELVSYQFIDMVTPNNNFFFAPTEKRSYKDTIRIPPRLGAKGTSKTIATLRVHFSDANRPGGVVAHGETPTFDPAGNFVSGGWLAHCHILEHSAVGMLSFFEVRDPADPFHLLGHSTDGTNGKPSMTVTGDLSSPGNPVTFELVNGPPNRLAYFLVGNAAANRSLAGGILVPGLSPDGGVTITPNPLFRYRTTPIDANGRATFSTTVWSNFLPGSKLYFQYIAKDPGAVAGWAISNAAMMTVP